MPWRKDPFHDKRDKAQPPRQPNGKKGGKKPDKGPDPKKGPKTNGGKKS
jgi:hypothetical protein